MTYPSHLTPVPRFAAFAIVGMSGFAAQTGLLALLTRVGGWHYSVALPVTAEATLLASFVCHARWTWRDRPVRGFRSATSRLARYQLAKATALGASSLLTVWLVTSAHLAPEAANAVAVGALALVSFGLVDRLIFVAPDPRSLIPDPQRCPHDS